jgi:DNA adenine methylase
LCTGGGRFFKKNLPLRTKKISLMVGIEKIYSKKIKSPLNYIGGKQKMLEQLLPLFPKSVRCFVDLFTGGGNVGINAAAERIVCNDNLSYLIEMYKAFQAQGCQKVLTHIDKQIQYFELSLTNEMGYKNLRTHYNQTKNPLDLFVLIAFSFNHQIRFNNSHEFNNPFGRERSSFNATMKNNLERFIYKLQHTNIEFTCHDFEKFDTNALNSNDFVYCDPPYLITTGSYNDGKRGFTGWNLKEEEKLLAFLDKLNQCNIPFALSNVLEHKGMSNDLLKKWSKKYHVHIMDADYSNSNYQTTVKDKNSSVEVLITNYLPQKSIQTALF